MGNNHVTTLLNNLDIVRVCVGSELVATTLLYTEYLANEYSCIHDLCRQLYLTPPRQILSWVKYYGLCLAYDPLMSLLRGTI